MGQPQNATPAEMFNQYFGPALFIPWARVLLEYAKPQRGERVLDLACATGTVARHAAPLVGARGKVVGLDINPGMLAVARKLPAPEGAKVDWREGDAMALELPDDAFDLVLCQQGLQFFPDRAAAAREMRRVLTEGGRVVLSVWQALERHPVYEALFEAEARYLGASLADLASPWSLADTEELRILLNEAGFERVEIISKTLEVHFPAPERFVYLTTFAAAAFLPGVNWEDEASRSALIEAVSREIAPIIEQYRNGDKLSFPASWNIAVAYG